MRSSRLRELPAECAAIPCAGTSPQQLRDFASALPGRCEVQCLSPGCTFKGLLKIKDSPAVLQQSAFPLKVKLWPQFCLPWSITLYLHPVLAGFLLLGFQCGLVSQKSHSVLGKGHASFARQSGRLSQKHRGPGVRPAGAKPQDPPQRLCVS